MAATGEVTLLMSLKGNALASLKALQSQLANFQTTFRAGFNLNLGAQAANFLLAIPGQLRNLAKESLALAGQLKDQAEATGVSTTALQVYRIAIENAGGKADLFDRAVANTNRSLVEARANSGSAADAYRRLGLNIETLSRLSIEQRFIAISKAIESSDDPLAAFSAAGQILGTKNLPTLLSALRDVSTKGFDEFATAAQRAGQLLSGDTIARLDKAEKAIERFKKGLVIDVGESISGAAEFAEVFRANKKDTIFGLFDAFIFQDYGRLLKTVAETKAALKPAAGTPPVTASSDPLATREAVVRVKIAALEQQRAVIEGDITNSSIEKNGKVIALLDQQAKLLGELQRLRTDGVNLSADESKLTEAQLGKLQEYRKIEAEILAIRQEQNGLGGVTRGRASRARDAAEGINDPSINPNFVSGRDAAGVGVNDFLSEAGSTGEQVAETITGTLGTAVQGISDGIYGWITGLNSFVDVARNVGLSILQETLDTVVKIGVQQILNGNAAKAIAIGWKALTSSLRAAETAEVVAAESVKAPFLATNAATASVGSFGVAAVVGIALLAGLLGAFIAGFESGGYTGSGGKSEPAGIVHRGEYVLTQAEVNRLGIGRIESFKNLRGYESGGFVSTSSAGGSRGSGGGSGGARTTILVDSERSAKRIQKNTQAETDIFNIVFDRRHELVT